MLELFRPCLLPRTELSKFLIDIDTIQYNNAILCICAKEARVGIYMIRWVSIYISRA
jgi:hypothetical protein